MGGSVARNDRGRGMIIAVDFDGTVAYDKFPEIGSPIPYAKEVIGRLHNDGHYIIINTCRAGEDLTNAVNWLLKEGIPFDRVNDNHPDNIRQFNNNTRKINADIYIDDKNVGGFMGWPEAYNWIKDKENGTIL